jgi:hypothetical protein
MAGRARLDPHPVGSDSGARRAGRERVAVTRSLLRRLNDHWFAPAPLEDLALARIVLVAMQLLLLLWTPLAMSGACKGCNLAYQQMIAAADPLTYQPIFAMKALMIPFGWGARPSPTLVHAIWLLAVGSGIGALIGLLTNASLLVFAATTTLLTAHAFSYGEVRHPEAVIVIALWVLALSPAGARRSVDALLRRRRAGTDAAGAPPAPTLSPHARWPLRLIQWVLVLAYLSAGYSKLRDGGIYWFNGYTLAFDIAYDSIDRGNPVGLWVAQFPHVLQLFSFGAVAIELGFWLILVFPALAWIIVLAGAGLHIGIYAFQLSSFPQYIALYIVFIGELRTAWPMQWLTARRTVAMAPVHP